MTRKTPLRSRREVDAYLDYDRIECLDCGKRFAFLPSHLARAHDTDAVDYRARWGLPAGTPLAGLQYRADHSTLLTRAIERGEFAPNAKRASRAARKSGRGKRVEWELGEQAERMGENAPRPVLADDDTRADGRNAGRAREYQRQYRKR